MNTERLSSLLNGPAKELSNYIPDFRNKLPDILSLMKTLMEKDTGLKYFETILRYLVSTMDDITTETIKEIAEQALSKKEGEYIMTLADKLRKEGP